MGAGQWRLTRFDTTVITVVGMMLATLVILILTDDTTVPGLRVAFMRTNDDGVVNIWLADPQAPDDAEQITFSETGVHDFGVSPDGTTIAFAERNGDAVNRNAEIKLLNIRTGTVQQVTNCTMQDADCTTPVWHPDGNVIAYQRMELNSDLSVGISPNRVWLLDLTSSPAETQPLIADSQVLGYSPVWSPSGDQLAFYDTAQSGIVVYDFAASAESGEPSLAFVPTTYGTVGDFSPDGTRLVFPEMLPGGPLVRAALQVADLENRDFNSLTDSTPDVDDQAAVWHPDGNRLAIARRYLDPDRLTRGHQVFLADADGEDVYPLVYDERYIHSFFSWSPDGEKLLMNRFPVLTPDGEANPFGTLEIWMYDMTSESLEMVVADGFQPRWVP
jgi:Tol biopolymer transport system component